MIVEYSFVHVTMLWNEALVCLSLGGVLSICVWMVVTRLVRLATAHQSLVLRSRHEDEEAQTLLQPSAKF